jgi:dethiobiotin synthetase
MNFFITGTDTEVGKTFFTALLLRTLRRAGIDAVGYKPIACGSWEDVDALVHASDGMESRHELCAYHFGMPASPLTASWAEERVIEPERLINTYETLKSRHEVVLVEGVGGWRVPITCTYSVSDFAAALGLPVIVVVRNRLGAINHTMLTLESIARAGLDCVGLVLNHFDAPDDPASHSNRATFELLPHVRILCELVHAQSTLDLASLALPGISPKDC